MYRLQAAKERYSELTYQKMNRQNYERDRDENTSYRRGAPARYRCVHHKRTVRRNPFSSRGERNSPYGHYDRTGQRSKSRSSYRESRERYDSDERKSAKRSSRCRHRRHSSDSSDEERKRSKNRRRSKLSKHRHRRSRRKPTKSPSRSPSHVKVTSNSSNIDLDILNALKEQILLALSSNREDKEDKPTATLNSASKREDEEDKPKPTATLNSASIRREDKSNATINSWDKWDIDVEPPYDSPGNEDMDDVQSPSNSSPNLKTEFQKNASNDWDSESDSEYDFTVDHLIDDEIIQKLISKPDDRKTPTTPDRYASIDFDLVKQAVSTVKMLEQKDTTTHTMINYTRLEDTNRSELPNVQPFTRQDVSGFQSYHHHPQPQIASYTTSSQTSRPNALPSTSTAEQRSLQPSSPVKLPIPSIKFLPRFSFHPPDVSSKPHPHHVNTYKVNHPMVNAYEPTTYGEYKRLQALNKSSEVNVEMLPMKTDTNLSAAVAFDSEEIKIKHECEITSSPPLLESSAETINLENSSPKIEHVTDPVENSSAEQQAIATLKAFMGTDQFTVLFDLMKHMTKGDTLAKLNASLNNTNSPKNDCTTANEEWDRDVISSTSSENNGTGTATTISKPTSSHREGTIQNNKREWHSLTKILGCQVCYRPHGNSLVSHYVNEHPDKEVISSRLAPEAADLLRSRDGIFGCRIIPVNLGYQYQQFCYFCNIYKCLPKSSWITHMARHTGYYAYKCNHCSRMLAQKLNHKCTKNNTFTKITYPQFHKRTKIKAYVCDLCNYVRFGKREIQKHLNEEHDDDLEHLKTFNKFNFLRFPAKKRMKWSNENESDTETESGSDCEGDVAKYRSDEKMSEDQSHGNEFFVSQPSELQDDSGNEVWTPMRCKYSNHLYLN